MDFSLSEEQQDIRKLAAQIMADRCTLDLLKEVEAGTDRFDRDLWASLAGADLIGLTLPEEVGGGGYGFTETCLLLEQQGAHLAPVPLWATLVCAAQPIARWGSNEQRQRWLPPVIEGRSVLTAALTEALAGPRTPATVAVSDGDGYRISGHKTSVPFVEAAEAMLVPASVPGVGPAIFIVDPRAPGITVERIETLNWEAEYRLGLDGVRVGPDALLGPPDAGGAVLNWIVDRATVGLCAISSGACTRAMRLTAEYTTTRKQFDRPIATFQAVGQRMADTFIDDQAINVTMWQAATRLDHERPSDKEVAVAKYWASEGGSRVGHAGLHLHGGISIDVDYPIHRYFLWIKQVEFSLGAATPQLARLGQLLAAD